MSERFPSGSDHPKSEPMHTPRLRGSCAYCMKSPETMSERFPARFRETETSPSEVGADAHSQASGFLCVLYEIPGNNV